jgi:hypothetical protein
MTRRRRPEELPAIGPCRDPLALWYLEFVGDDGTTIFRRYFGNRNEARTALRVFKQERAGRPASVEKRP